MGVGTKHRQQQTADLCKLHLREKHPDKLVLVEDIIHKFEGSGKDRDITRWSQFMDIKDIKEEMLKRLDEHFEGWLNPSDRCAEAIYAESHLVGIINVAARL